MVTLKPKYRVPVDFFREMGGGGQYALGLLVLIKNIQHGHPNIHVLYAKGNILSFLNNQLEENAQ